LTYYKYKKHLKCRHCGYIVSEQKTCSTCGNTDTLCTYHPGIEKLNEELIKHFPDARIITITRETFETEDAWEKSFCSIFKHCIDVQYNDVPEKDYEFWVVAFHDENDQTLYRKDADQNEIERMMKDSDGYCKIWREFQTERKPKYWVVWPYSKTKGWCEKISSPLPS
jgi:hypothetical protein